MSNAEKSRQENRSSNDPQPSSAASRIVGSNPRSIIGFFAKGLPLVSTILIVAILFVIVLHFAIAGLPALSWEFLTAPPENVNTEGGVFPAIYGTVLLVLIMSIAAVPIGTITAVYLAEYAARTSKLAQFIRFAVNTLAGVPSIVFGLFGLGFFIQTIGAGIDSVSYDAKMERFERVLAVEASPLSGGSAATIDETRGYLASLPDNDDWVDQRRKIAGLGEGGVKVTAAEAVEYLATRPELDWGRPNLLWAALTLALLTLPVVIVAVEESLRSVPAEVRAASLALGATRWETVRKIVLPNSVTGILTGSILAVGRGAGEVAPILFTGAIYSATQLPGVKDQFMHLGYHLYILSTQSPDVEKTMPLQFATTIVLLLLTLALNTVAILIRSRLRKKQ